jgi:hypothetical protein
MEICGSDMQQISSWRLEEAVRVLEEEEKQGCHGVSMMTSMTSETGRGDVLWPGTELDETPHQATSASGSNFASGMTMRSS